MNSVKSRTRFVLRASPCVEPECPMHGQAGARHLYQTRVAVADEARQFRHADPLLHRHDLRLGVRGSERNSRSVDFSMARPFRYSIIV